MLVYIYVNLYSMTMHIRNKLNWLERALPEGLLVDAAWLEVHGYSRSLRSHYVNAGWLEQPARSVYRRPRGCLSWEQVVISLQTLLHFPVSVGGRTALDLQGYAHYLPQSQQVIQLYTDTKLPGWVTKLPLGLNFETHNRARFLPQIDRAADMVSISTPVNDESTKTRPGALRIVPWGQWEWPLVVSPSHS